jgi:uncharacterized protein
MGWSLDRERGCGLHAVITLDVNAVVALLVRDERHHAPAVSVLTTARQPVVVPLAILADVDDALDRRSSRGATIPLLDGIQRGDTLLDCGDLDLPRIRELMTRYADLPLSLSDAAVTACAERNGGSILSFDRPGIRVVARDALVTVFP